MCGACPPIFMAGDNAVVTTGSPGKVASADDYYPFGMVMEGRSFNYGQADARYKFSSPLLPDQLLEMSRLLQEASVVGTFI